LKARKGPPPGSPAFDKDIFIIPQELVFDECQKIFQEDLKVLAGSRRYS